MDSLKLLIDYGSFLEKDIMDQETRRLMNRSQTTYRQSKMRMELM